MFHDSLKRLELRRGCKNGGGGEEEEEEEESKEQDNEIKMAQGYCELEKGKWLNLSQFSGKTVAPT
jgi:hypothetical protein